MFGLGVLFMGLEEIKLKILNDAQDTASEILDKANLKAHQIMEEAEDRAKSAAENILKLAGKNAEKEKRRILTLARLKSKNLVLTEKQKLIEDVFEGALNRLNNLSDGEYRSFVEKFILKTVSSGEEEIIISPASEKSITDDLISEINSELIKNGKVGKLKLSSERREIGKGFILKSTNAEIDCTFKAIIEESKNEMEPEVVKVLFS